MATNYRTPDFVNSIVYHYEHDDFDSCLDLCDGILGEDNDHYEANLYRGFCTVMLDSDHKSALPFFQQAAKAESLTAMLTLAECMENIACKDSDVDKLYDVKCLYEQIALKFPDSAPTWIGLTEICKKLKLPFEAAEAAKNACALNPENPALRSYYALCRLNLDDLGADVESDLRRAWEEDSNLHDAGYNLVMLQIHHERLDEAYETARRLRSIIKNSEPITAGLLETDLKLVPVMAFLEVRRYESWKKSQEVKPNFIFNYAM